MTDCFACRFEFGRRTFKFSYNCVKCARHVRASVTIWHWVDIQTVDAAGMKFHRVAEGDHRVTQGIRPKFF